MEEDSVLTRMLQAVAVPVIGNVCYVFMHGLNKVQVILFGNSVILKFQCHQRIFLATIFF